jgi:hypothetical protein
MIKIRLNFKHKNGLAEEFLQVILQVNTQQNVGIFLSLGRSVVEKVVDSRYRFRRFRTWHRQPDDTGNRCQSYHRRPNAIGTRS